jgi:hypothetical protein
MNGKDNVSLRSSKDIGIPMGQNGHKKFKESEVLTICLDLRDGGKSQTNEVGKW